MWNENDYYYQEREAQYRPVWPHRPHRPQHPGPYARPRELPPYVKPDMSGMLSRCMLQRFPRIPELTTPHAGPSVQRPLPLARPAHPPLYQDFSAPARPAIISMNIQSSAIKCVIEWKQPNLSKTVKYIYELEVWEGVQCDKFELAPYITSFSLRTTPGSWYRAKIACVDKTGTVLALGQTEFKAVFSHEEMQLLYKKAVDHCGTGMNSFHVLYRCKPKMYYDDIIYRRQGLMEKYLKDNNGQAASSINGAISGLFFSARVSAEGMLPLHSPFGNLRFRIPAISLLDPNRINMYFSDFYCNYLTHYITVVICERYSQSDIFCMQRLIKLVPDANPFLKIVTRPPLYEPEFYVNKTLWVEIFYTESVPLTWGSFDSILATGAGTSRIGGLPHNKECKLCNLYPLIPTSAKPNVEVKTTFQLLLSLKDSFRTGTLDDCHDVIETICGLVDVVVGTEHMKNMDVRKKDKRLLERKQLEPASEVVARLIEKLDSEDMKGLAICLKNLTNDLDDYFEIVEQAIDDAKSVFLSNTIIAV